jgi:hypothetical protein
MSEAHAVSKSLNPALPPGKNFNLSGFSLQLPTGSSGNVDTISGAQLAAGYTNSPYFYTYTDGSMVMMDPVTGWTTSGSQHPRTELRDTTEWKATGSAKLDATLVAQQVRHHTAIGQIFQGSGSPSKPLCELQVTSGGAVQLLLERNSDGGSASTTQVASVKLGDQFSYELNLNGTKLTVRITTQSVTTKTFDVDSSFKGRSFYFKAGNYDQTATSGKPSATPSSIVRFYALKTTH